MSTPNSKPPYSTVAKDVRSELLPVIHFLDMDTTIRNAKMAADHGCPGVFLIHMQLEDEKLDAPIGVLRQMFPQLKIGVNRLSTEPTLSISRNIELGADYTWSDHCGVNSLGLKTEAVMASSRLTLHPQHKYFGSVAFKYQMMEPNPPRAAKYAYDAGFIPTTSGAGTGHAPEVAKIRGMAEALPEKILAVASGITPRNVDQFIPYVRYFLVATGISRNEFEFDEKLLAALAEKLR